MFQIFELCSLIFLIFSLDVTNGGLNSRFIQNFAGTTVNTDGPSNVQFALSPVTVGGDSLGIIYYGDQSNCLIRQVNESLYVRTIIGSGKCGSSSYGPAATALSIGRMGKLFVDKFGNIYFTDIDNHLVRQYMSTTRYLYLFAGNYLTGFTDNVPATSSGLNTPYAVYVDTNQVVYIADTNNQRIRKVVGGIITTVAGTGLAGSTGNGGPATSAQLNGPFDIQGDTSGNLYIADSGNAAIRFLSSTGILSTYISGLSSPQGLFYINGYLLVADTVKQQILQYQIGGSSGVFAGNGVAGLSSETPIAATSSYLGSPTDIYYDATRNGLFIAEYGTGIVSYVNSGVLYRLIGFTVYFDNGPATLGRLHYPVGIWGDTTGKTYITDNIVGKVRTVSSAGIISTISSVNYATYGIWGDTGGNLYLADPARGLVYKVTSSNVQSVFAGSTQSCANGYLYNPYGVWMDTNGILFVTDVACSIVSYVINGGLGNYATGVVGAVSIWGDSGTKIYFTQTGSTNAVNCITSVDRATNTVRTIAGTGGNSAITGNYLATMATLSLPGAITGDTAGNLYFLERNRFVVRMLTPLPSNINRYNITTIIGNGNLYTGGGPMTGNALSVAINRGLGLWIDSNGVIYLADTYINVVRSITPVWDPSSQPTSQPTGQPSSQPSTQPTGQPTGQPSSQPSTRPTSQPTGQPSSQPSTQPSAQPVCFPTSRPTTQPSTAPTFQPVSGPSSQPTTQPSRKPSSQPSRMPSTPPTSQPSNRPSSKPSRAPSIHPTTEPSSHPSSQPTSQPLRPPTAYPSINPTSHPSDRPSVPPSSQPSNRPSFDPTVPPTDSPKTQPSSQPTSSPSINPSSDPSNRPSSDPSSHPFSRPTTFPLNEPSNLPSPIPTRQPTAYPSSHPSLHPFSNPSTSPLPNPTSHPFSYPSTVPSSQPSIKPSCAPSCTPSTSPSSHPPTTGPSQSSDAPTVRPSFIPTTIPSTDCPTILNSFSPSAIPSISPTTNNFQSTEPSFVITNNPTASMNTNFPSIAPTPLTTIQVINISTLLPTIPPTVAPSSSPSIRGAPAQSPQPSITPTTRPTFANSQLPQSTNVTVLSKVFPIRFKESLLLLGATKTLPSTVLTDINLSDVGPRSVGTNYVVFGGSSLPSLITLSEVVLTPDSDVTVVEFNTGIVVEDITRSVAIAGDVNHDNIKDLIIGDPTASKIYILYGVSVENSSNPWKEMNDGYVISSSSSYDYLGWAVSTAGDFNADGIDDIIVSAIQANRCYIVYGTPNSRKALNLNNVMEASEGLTITASLTTARTLGLAVSGGYDFNGDGIADVIMSGLITVSSSDVASVIYVVYGGAQSTVSVSLDGIIYAGGGFKIVAPVLSFAAMSLDMMKDINGDQFADIVIGSIPYQGQYITQRSYVVYGRNRSDSHILSLNDMTKEDGLVLIGAGLMVSAVGDINQDGYDDVMVSDFTGWQGNSRAYTIVFPQVGSISSYPTFLPSSRPSIFVNTSSPSYLPSIIPTNKPTAPTASPTFSPTGPSELPTVQPTSPTIKPTVKPNYNPSAKPSVRPSMMPTIRPTSTKSPTFTPTVLRTIHPTTRTPSRLPTRRPTTRPTRSQTQTPTVIMTQAPTVPFNTTVIVKGGKYTFTGDTNYDITVKALDDDVTLVMSTGLKNSQRLYRISIMPSIDVVIQGFDAVNDIIDLQAFRGINNISDVSYSTNPLIIVLPNKQAVILPSLTSLQQLSAKNFLFSTVKGSITMSSSDDRSKGLSMMTADLIITTILFSCCGFIFIIQICRKADKKIDKGYEEDQIIEDNKIIEREGDDCFKLEEREINQEIQQLNKSEGEGRVVIVDIDDNNSDEIFSDNDVDNDFGELIRSSSATASSLLSDASEVSSSYKSFSTVKDDVEFNDFY